MRTKLWDVVFIVGALFGVVVSARYYVVAVLDRDRRLARAAAVGFLLFSITTVLYIWRFL